VFASLAVAQAELDARVADYNHRRPYQAIGMVPPATRFLAAATQPLPIRPTVDTARPAAARGDGDWVARRANAVGVITVNWQQIVLGKAAAGREVDVWVTDEVVQVYDGGQLLRTQLRRGGGQVRKKRPSVPGGTIYSEDECDPSPGVDVSPINRTRTALRYCKYELIRCFLVTRRQGLSDGDLFPGSAVVRG
jgi:hypothetical protein